ncbi:glycoside hydrolase family 24 protein [Acinetobacter baumannii]|uniref:glycoside hydrolase family 24 protein n=1 Tax=Acinetobacter baumannii TaxID=470 RepID=UPI0020231C34|nr:glycoside hydrolase family 104 protein [Acinetobacter baumannii]MCL8261838.1 glycoside hydrolase family 104 protein [Acinetobacter baumannii]
MATSQQLMQLMNNPNARKMLDLIAATEGVKYGYNTLFGNQKIDDLSWHPNIKKPFKQTDGQVKYTTAAGRYQFLKDTWDGVARQYGLKDFSPQSQDLGALALLAQNGALPYVLKGDFGTAIKKSGSTWASLPTSPYAQNKRSWDFVNQHLANEGPARVPIGGKWAELTGKQDMNARLPVQSKWENFVSQQSNQSGGERLPISGKWAELINGG